MAAIRIKQRISLAFKTRLSRRRPQQKTRILQPQPHMLFLGLTLWVGEARNRRNPMQNHRRMSHKHHIRRAFPRMQKPHVSDSLKLLVQIFPLHKSSIARRLMKITRHPRVDDVVNVVPLRRAHQVGWAIEVR
jgi:hypothetical protein